MSPVAGLRKVILGKPNILYSLYVVVLCLVASGLRRVILIYG